MYSLNTVLQISKYLIYKFELKYEYVIMHFNYFFKLKKGRHLFDLAANILKITSLVNKSSLL